MAKWISNVLFVPINLYLSLFANEDHSFSKAQEDVKRAFYWVYPYPQIVSYLRDEGKKSILIFSYGSLMDSSSAARSLSKISMATRRPGIAFGIRRLFDRDVPICKGSKWGIPNDPNARGMLNIMLSEQPEDFINGVLVDVILEDIPDILCREEEYDLLPIVVQNWDNIANSEHPHYLIAYTFHAPQGSGATNSTILPRPGYYELTRNASLLYGQIFYQIWLNTTYFADGITPITEWEKEILQGKERTKFTYDSLDIP